MDHLPWYSQSHLSPVKVPFICGDKLLCGKDEFLEFPTRQGWELKQSESLAQLAARAQAWLFFGLLAVAGIPPDVCISTDTSTIAGQIINTSALPFALRVRPFWCSDDETSLKGLSNDDILELTKAFTRAEHVMIQEVIPLINDYEEEPLTLWNSPFYAVLFSIDILMENIAAIIPLTSRKGEQESFFPESLFSKRTAGVAHSLLQARKCPSLARRLDIRSSEFYHLLSLPTIPMTENHSECSQTSCSCFDVDTISYRTRHTDDCNMCGHLVINEEELVDLIQQDEVPLLRSTMDSEGSVTISLTKMNVDVDHTAISHVWAGGLGNFNENSLPHCQLQAIHRDVCNTMWHSRGGNNKPPFPAENSYAEQRSHRWWPARRKNTCYYWLDTLCIPIHDYNMKIRAINSMGRIYAGARNILVLDPSLSKTKYNDLGDCKEREIRANLLVAASPWMARSWPLQEAMLAPEIYVKFADDEIYYRHSNLGVAVTLSSIPHQDENRVSFTWFGGIMDQNAVFQYATQVRPYEPSTDFAKIWNLLCKRTTSYPVDVPAIFAALLHKSSGELLQISPHRRTQAIMNSVESLPLDILCVKQKFNGNQGTTPTLNWVPEFPGSKVLVSQLDSRWGTLRRVRDGFVVEMNEKEPTATLAMICPSGLLPSGKSIVRDDHSMKSFLIQVDRPPSTSKGKASNSTKQAQLLLLLCKDHSHIPFLKHGILCTVIAETDGILRVQFDVAIGWSPQGDENSEHVSLHSFRVEPSSSIVIEMDVDQWPTLAWSRFGAFPYQHLEAQYLQFDMECAYIFIDVIWILFLIAACFMVPESDDLNPPGSSPYMRYCVLFIFIATSVRFLLASLEGAHINSEMARRARYIWALSFWDLDENKRVLSQLHISVSLTTFLKTLIPALIFSSQLAILITRHVSTYIWFLTALPFVIEYGCRLVLLIFLRVQWFFSTLEFHSDPGRALSPRKLVAALLHAHFFRILFVIAGLIFAAGIFRIVIIAFVPILQPGHLYIGDGHYSEEIQPQPVAGIIVVVVLLILPFSIFGLFCLFLTCYEIWFIILDVYRRVQKRSKKIRQQILDQDVELV